MKLSTIIRERVDFTKQASDYYGFYGEWVCMADKEYTLESFKRIVRNVFIIERKNANVSNTAAIMERKAEKISVPIPKTIEEKVFDKTSYVKTLRDKISELEDENRLANEMFLSLSNIISGVNAGKRHYEPLREYVEPKSGSVGIVHVADPHYGETVNFKGDFKTLNKYDTVIARKRMQYFFDSCFTFAIENKIKNLIITFTGDNFTGLIHEELKYGINNGIFDLLIELAECVGYCLQECAKAFNVKVMCVSGNHGRLSNRIEFKFKATNNIDYMFYMLLKALNPNIHFEIPQECFHREQINGKSYLFTHGDHIKATKNLSGAPVITGAREASSMAKIYRYANIDNLECEIIGHHHTFFYVGGMSLPVLGTASMIGPGDYSINNGFYSPASQSLIVINGTGVIDTIKQVFLNHIMV